jgi:hypothetical protein
MVSQVVVAETGFSADAFVKDAQHSEIKDFAVILFFNSDLSRANLISKYVRIFIFVI